MHPLHYGFGASGRGQPYQYYTLQDTQRKAGNPVHSFATEEAIFRQMAKDDRVRFCDDRGCFGTTKI